MKRPGPEGPSPETDTPVIHNQPNAALGPPKCLVSIHDVMPETLDAVDHSLAILAESAVRPITLLVVPGRAWETDAIDRLKRYADQGHRLAAHGWHHRAKHVRGLYHRLHGMLLSRRVAEHLALDAEGILELMRNSRHWFLEQGLSAPTLYVPPAWAMGRISAARLKAEGPFARYEVFGGILDSAADRWVPTPMLGYEADQPGRVLPLRLWNSLNRLRARRANHLRIGIHPFDLRYRLAEDLRRDLKQYRNVTDYDDL